MERIFSGAWKDKRGKTDEAENKEDSAVEGETDRENKSEEVFHAALVSLEVILILAFCILCICIYFGIDY